MDDDLRLDAILAPILRRLPLIVGCAAIAAVVAGALATLQPVTYQASALVIATQPQLQPQFNTQIQSSTQTTPPYRAYGALIKSAAVAQLVLAQDRQDFPDPRTTPEDVVGRVMIAPGDDPSIFVVTAADPNPQRAARIANAWSAAAATYINNLYQPTSADTKTLQAQLPSAEKNLKDAEDALASFQQSNDLVVLENTRDAKIAALKSLETAQQSVPASVYAARIDAETQSLQSLLDARNHLQLVMQDARSLQAQIKQQGSTGATRSNLQVLLVELEALNSTQSSLLTTARSAPAGTAASQADSAQASTQASWSPTTVQIQVPIDPSRFADLSPAEQTAALDSLLTTLTQKDAALAQQIDRVSQQLITQSDSPALLPSASPVPSASGPVADQIAQLTREIGDLQQQIAQRNETLDRLTINRDVAKTAYQALTSKLAEVQLTDQIGGSEVRIASPAAVPDQPVASRRSRSVALGGLAGLVVGVLLALGLEYLPMYARSLPRQGERPAPALVSSVAAKPE